SGRFPFHPRGGIMTDEVRCWTSSGGWIWKEARRLFFLGLLLRPPDDHLPAAARVFFDPNRKRVSLVDPEVFAHVLRDRDPAAHTDRDVRVVERPIDCHRASSYLHQSRVI